MKLQIAGFLEHSTVNGAGLRSVLFVSGCKHACPGCHNEVMQNINYGESISISEIYQRIIKNKPLIDGVTFSGGEPFDQCQSLAHLAHLLKPEGFTIWCYSGYTYDYLKQSPEKRILLDLVDVLIDGPFIRELTDESLKYRGSANQHIYQLSQGKIISNLDEIYKLC